MENVEELLAGLVSSWEIDLYLRLECVESGQPVSATGAVGASEEEVAEALRSRWLRGVSERAIGSRAPVVGNDLQAVADDRPPLGPLQRSRRGNPGRRRSLIRVIVDE